MNKRNFIRFASLLLSLAAGCLVPAGRDSITIDDENGSLVWASIKHDDRIKVCFLNLSSSSTARHPLGKMAESFPSMESVVVHMEPSSSTSSNELDCAELNAATNIVLAEIVNYAGTIRNIEPFCRDSRKKSVLLSFSPGEGLYHHDNICSLPEETPVDVAECFYGTNSCTLGVEMIGGFFCQDENVYRMANFSNEGDAPVSIREFPASCNAVELMGEFDLSRAETGQSINFLSWVSTDGDFEKMIRAITPERFPNLRFLRLCLGGRQERDVDLRPLTKLIGVRVFALELFNVIPVGMEGLYEMEGLWGVTGFISVDRE